MKACVLLVFRFVSSFLFIFLFFPPFSFVGCCLFCYLVAFYSLFASIFLSFLYAYTFVSCSSWLSVTAITKKKIFWNTYFMLLLSHWISFSVLRIFCFSFASSLYSFYTIRCAFLILWCCVFQLPTYKNNTSPAFSSLYPTITCGFGSFVWRFETKTKMNTKKTRVYVQKH